MRFSSPGRVPHTEMSKPAGLIPDPVEADYPPPPGG